jgi:hypothetical protein
MRSWVIVFLVTAAMFAWIATIHYLVGDQPRPWTYGSEHLLPGEASYSTAPLPAGPAPEQVPPHPPPPGASP